MPKLIIENLLDLNGEYEVDTTLTHRDFRIIKQVSGVRASELEDALQAGDSDVVVAIAAITLRKAGKGDVVDALLDSPVGSITLVLDEEEAPADPRSAGGENANGNVSDSAPQPSGDDTSNGTAHFPETSTELVSGTPV